MSLTSLSNVFAENIDTIIDIYRYKYYKKTKTTLTMENAGQNGQRRRYALLLPLILLNDCVQENKEEKQSPYYENMKTQTQHRTTPQPST